MQYFSHHADPDIPAPPPPKRVHIKDVEDEGDISKGPEQWVEDFPGPAGEPLHSRGSQETTFQCLRHEKMEKGEEMWVPFESWDEWDLVQWLMKAGVSQSEMEKFLQLGVIKESLQPSFENKRKLFQHIDTLPTGPEWECEVFVLTGDEKDEDGKLRTEEVELWKRNPIECICELMGNSRFVQHMKYAPERVYTDESGQSRAYSEMSTADWWWATQVSSIKLLPKGATIAAVILATDKTQLSQFSGDKQAWPVYLTIGNIDKDIRQKLSEHATVLIGYLPISKLECFNKKTQSTQSYQLFHTCMRSLLDPLVEAGKNGVKILCADGKTRMVYPLLAAYVADYPEQCLVGCCMENRCPKCLSKSDLLRNPVHSILRDPEKTIRILKQTADGHKPQAFTDQGLHPVDPFWRKLPHCNIFNCFTPDILHQLHKGVFKDHVVSWATEVVHADKPKEELDCCFRAMTCHPSLRHFKKGISLVSQWTGNKYKNMEKVFLSVLDGSVQDEVVECVQSVLDFIYYAHFEEHTDESLSKLDEAWHTFHKKKAIFIDLDIQQHFNIPKVHSTMHYATMIRSYGMADSFNTEASEQLHIDFAKIAYNASNKRDYVKQMAIWLRRQEAVDNFYRFLDWAVEEYEELEVDKAERDDEDEDNAEAVLATNATDANNPMISASTALDNDESPGSDVNIDLDTLDKKYGSTEFVYALESFLCCHGMYRPNFWDAWPAKYEVFKQCQIYVPPTPEVSKLVTIDPIRASPMVPAHGCNKEIPAQFDTVLAWKKLPKVGTDLDLLGNKGLHVGQVHVIFNLPEQLGTFPHPLAYIEWFTPLHKLDNCVGMFKVQRSTHGSQWLRASIIPVTYISQSCQLSPYFGHSMDCTWSSNNVLDLCQSFHVNSYLRHIDFVLLRYKCHPS
ncbi:hypothetical protein EDD18DRAFT_1083189 [Armillaria luteobubalina]|uniref:CxC2-like cysteine cluster KDZ transposase-associated domain-containing protein n=1 Tax=Armillaria luteobubalina TaxID=153913 RepID=A0AA39PKS0_9AGAR|nr:hypothetical protein EDD18DRAFT_1083189 [Armillaria luteobubalina]